MAPKLETPGEPGVTSADTSNSKVTTTAVLRVPDVAPDTDPLTAALAYAEAGWYVAPVKRGSKSPGSILGKAWPRRTSRDLKVITAWFAGTDYGIALHCGRSGAVVLDVDRPERAAEWLTAALDAHGVPFQSSRPDQPHRGHLVYAMPPGRTIGNPKIPGGAGEVRGLNGVIVVAPSAHKDGGEYRWQRVGPVPELPADIAEQLPAGKPGEDAATDAAVGAFLDKHRGGLTEDGWRGPVRELARAIAAGESRHESAVKSTVWAMDEAAADCYAAKPALVELKRVFLDAVVQKRKGMPDDRVRTDAESRDEWRGIVAWAVGQALAKTPEQIKAKYAAFQQHWSPTEVNTTDRCAGADAADQSTPLSGSETGGGDEVTLVYAGQLLTRSDLRSLPEPEPLIDNVLDKGTLAYLYGRWGTLKTFVALDWALCVATGKPWQSRRSSQCRVLYVVGEGAFGFKGRVAAWEAAWRTSIGDDEIDILPVAVNLSNTLDVANLCVLVQSGGYGFVIIDTLSRCMVGADENSAKDCGVVVAAMTRVLACTPHGRGVVLGVHHAGKDGKTFRGSSVFEAAADTVYFSGRDDGETAVTLKREKRKDGPEHDAHQLAFDPIPGTDSGVLKLSHGAWDTPGTDTFTAKLRSIWSQHFGTTGASVS